MKTISLTSGASLEEIVRDVEREQDVLILRDGRPVALLTPFDDDDLEWYARERHPALVYCVGAAAGRAR